jgi:hypothetical protein
VRISQDRTAASPSLLHAHAATGWAALGLVADCHGDGEFEDFVYAGHFFAAAFHVLGAHAFRYCCALLGGYGGETLGLEEVNAGAFCSEVRLETDEDERGLWAEMKDLGIPLWRRKG